MDEIYTIELPLSSPFHVFRRSNFVSLSISPKVIGFLLSFGFGYKISPPSIKPIKIHPGDTWRVFRRKNYNRVSCCTRKLTSDKLTGLRPSDYLLTGLLTILSLLRQHQGYNRRCLGSCWSTTCAAALLLIHLGWFSLEQNNILWGEKLHKTWRS